MVNGTVRGGDRGPTGVSGHRTGNFFCKIAPDFCHFFEGGEANLFFLQVWYIKSISAVAVQMFVNDSYDGGESRGSGEQKTMHLDREKVTK